MSRSFVTASSEYLRRGQLIVSAVPFSVSVWFQPTVVNINQRIFDIGSTTDVQFFEMRINNVADQIISHFDGVSEGRARFDGSAVAGTWQQLGGVFASSTSRSIYTNGVLRHTETTAVGTPSGIDSTTLGANLRSGVSANFFGGLMAELGVWNVALDDFEMAALGAGVSPALIRPASCVGYFPVFGRDATEIDRSRRATFDLTPTGTARADHPRIIYPS